MNPKELEIIDAFIRVLKDGKIDWRGLKINTLEGAVDEMKLTFIIKSK